VPFGHGFGGEQEFAFIAHVWFLSRSGGWGVSGLLIGGRFGGKPLEGQVWGAKRGVVAEAIPSTSIME
jgi:hypothetical protein